MPDAKEGTPLLSTQASQRFRIPWLWYQFKTREGALFITLYLMSTTSVLRSGVMTSLVSSQQPELLAAGYPSALSVWPGLSACFTASGKLSQIVVIRIIGAYWTICIALMLISIGLFLISTGHESLMAIGLSMSAFSNAHLWGSGVGVLANWVPGEHMGSAVGAVMGAASDGSTMLFSVVISVLQSALAPAGSWGATFVPFLMFAGLVGVHALSNFLFLRRSAEDAGFDPPTAPPPRLDAEAVAEENQLKHDDGAKPEIVKTELTSAGVVHPLEGVDTGTAVRVFLSHGRVYLAMGICTFFAMVTAFPSYVGTFGVDIGLSDSVASLLLVAAGGGNLIADLGAGFMNDHFTLRTFKRVGIITQLLGAVSAVAVLALYVARQFEALHAVLPVALFFINVPIGLYWNVVVAVFSVRFGGPSHAHTLSGLMDFISFVCVIPVQFGFGSLITAGHWTAVLVLTVSFFLSGCISTNLHQYFEERLPSLPTV